MYQVAIIQINSLANQFFCPLKGKVFLHGKRCSNSLSRHKQGAPELPWGNEICKLGPQAWKKLRAGCYPEGQEGQDHLTVQMDPRTPALEKGARAVGDLRFRTQVRRNKNGVLKDSDPRDGSLFPRSLWEGQRKCGEPVCPVYTDLIIALVWQAEEFTQACCMTAQRFSAGKTAVKLRLRLTPLRHRPSI